MKKKSIAELGHSDHLKIYIDHGFSVHLNGHDQSSGLQNDKIQRGRESKKATDAKNSKTNKINQNGLVYLDEILYEALVGP